MEKNNDWNALETVLKSNNKSAFEKVKEELVQVNGLDYFRKLQNDIFWSWADEATFMNKE